ncbi:unnamed protein product [Amoebophrya sp. A120]|nr:unnamed protein product [Amoebophrya sp. A120]|eukprot:GSA120T00024693001.1
MGVFCFRLRPSPTGVKTRFKFFREDTFEVEAIEEVDNKPELFAKPRLTQAFDHLPTLVLHVEIFNEAEERVDTWVLDELDKDKIGQDFDSTEKTRNLLCFGDVSELANPVPPPVGEGVGVPKRDAQEYRQDDGALEVEFRTSQTNLGLEQTKEEEQIAAAEAELQVPPKLHEYSLTLRVDRLAERIAELRKLKLEIVKAELIKSGAAGSLTEEECQKFVTETESDLLQKISSFRAEMFEPWTNTQEREHERTGVDLGNMQRSRKEHVESVDLLSRRLRELEFQR